MGLILTAHTSSLTNVMWGILVMTILLHEILGRALFYVAVVAMRMPGSFFWKNAGFQKHAQTSGLAQMPQVGVLPKDAYHDLQWQRVKNDVMALFSKLKRVKLKSGFNQTRRWFFSRI